MRIPLAITFLIPLCCWGLEKGRWRGLIRVISRLKPRNISSKALPPVPVGNVTPRSFGFAHTDQVSQQPQSHRAYRTHGHFVCAIFKGTCDEPNSFSETRPFEIQRYR